MTVGVASTQVSAASTVSFHAGINKTAPPAKAAKVVRREIFSMGRFSGILGRMFPAPALLR